MAATAKDVVWLSGQVKTPPFSTEARLEAGMLLRQLQRGTKLTMPQSRSMPTVGARCHELRIQDRGTSWRIVYRVDTDAIVILEVFKKDGQRAPKSAIANSKRRLSAYDNC